MWSWLIPLLQLLIIFVILGVAIAFLKNPAEMIKLTVKMAREMIRFSVKIARKISKLIFYRKRLHEHE